MSNDYAYCADHSEECPEDCFRFQVKKWIDALENNITCSWAHFEGTEECVKGK